MDDLGRGVGSFYGFFKVRFYFYFFFKSEFDSGFEREKEVVL